MFTSALIVLCLTAAPREATLASAGLTTVGVSEAQADVYLDYFSQQVMLAGSVKVTTRAEVQALLGLERQRQLIGCAEGASSCLAELGGALGTDALIVGSLAKSDAGYVANLKVVGTSTGRVLGIYSERLNNEGALYDFLKASAVDLAARLRAAGLSTGSEPPPAAVVQVGLKRRAWVPAAVGGALLLGGVLCVVLAAADRQSLVDPATKVTNPDAVVQTGQLKQGLGWALGGVGLAALVTAAAFHFFGDDGPRLTFGFGPQGGAVVLSGRWP